MSSLNQDHIHHISFYNILSLTKTKATKNNSWGGTATNMAEAKEEREA
jgi:hypothetical protein